MKQDLKLQQTIQPGCSSGDPEFESILAEVRLPDRQAAFDGAAIAKLDARIQAHLDGLDRDRAQMMAEFEAGISASRPRMPHKALRMMVLAYFILAAGGVMMEVTVGQTFVFAYGREYRAAMPWVFGLLLLFMLLAFALADRRNDPMRVRYPNPWRRWLSYSGGFRYS